MPQSSRLTAPPPAAERPWWLVLLPLASVPLLWFAWHPVDQGWLAYVALSPWFAFLILETRVRRACSMTFWTWFLFFTLGMNWLRYTTDAAFLAISAILALEMFAFAWFARRWLARRNDAWAWLAVGVA